MSTMCLPLRIEVGVSVTLQADNCNELKKNKKKINKLLTLIQISIKFLLTFGKQKIKNNCM
jgi:hypothetical protein